VAYLNTGDKLDRILLNELIEWKDSADRSPVMLDGARQVGKSYLIESIFGKMFFKKVFKLNFEDNPVARELFSGSIKADDILNKVSLYHQEDFNAESDLLFFDEIGLCEQALNSLKYFKEQRPDVYLCASGSNIGLIDRYPVDQTYEMTLYPMSFYEFILASPNKPLIRAFKEKECSLVTHELLSELYRQYLYVGGMPSSVKKWFTSKSPIIKKTLEVRKIQNDLITGYVRDFGKYDSSNKFLASYLESVFRSVPKQLSKSVDTSVKRFQFSKVIAGKSGYRYFQSLIDYLLSTHLISKSQIIERKPPVPLSINDGESRFKLFSHDVGILHALLNIPYKQVIDQSYTYKGFSAENFAQNEFLANGVSVTYAWQSKGKAELEFLMSNANGDTIPVEIKSGKNTKAKSLDVYLDRYNPAKAYKFCDLVGGGQDSVIHTRPLYYICYAAEYITGEWDLNNYF